MRAAAWEKLGYYPTPNKICEILTTWVKASEKPGRFFDPCAGKGIAASIIGPAGNAETWGVELSPGRADEAMRVMDKCLQAPWETCTLSDSSVTICFNNPPYSQDKEFKRLEWKFLKNTISKLIPGGLLVYIVPQHILGMEQVATSLVKHFENINIYRFPDGLFEQFKQVVVMATKRQKAVEPELGDIHDIGMRAEGILPELEPIEEPVYQLLEAPSQTQGGRPITFRRNDLQDDDIIAEAMKKGVLQRKDWADLLDPDRNKRKLETPLLPLKHGHIAMVMASGMMGTIKLQSEDGPLLIKGRVVKTVEQSEEVRKNGDKVEKFKDKFNTSVASIYPDGKIEVITEVEDLTKFMNKYGEQIAEHVMNTYKPLYNMEQTTEESAILDTIGRNRKPLPGQDEPGLLPAQRHAAAALARSVRKMKYASIQGEMGVGKTTISIGANELLNAYPAIVLCPPHLVPKWIREIQTVLPGGYAREITRIGQLSSDMADVNDVRVFLEDYAKAEAHAKSHNLPRPKWFAVVANTAAKFGGTWEPIGIKKHVYQKSLEKMSVYYTCPNCGKTIMIKGNYEDKAPLIALSEISKKRTFCDNLIKGWKLDEHGHRVYDEEGGPIWDKRPCGTPLFSFQQKRRYSIAEYINKHHKGAFKLLLADEAHQFKSKSSDRGQAFYHLVKACNATITLTGTFFGGKSTSIFWLLHRLNHGVREDFGFHEETRFARLYGVLETTRKRKASDEVDDAAEDGIYTGNRRYTNRAQEKPGISPAIIGRLLDSTIFLSLKDLQLGLPEYSEAVTTFDMDGDQAHQYAELENDLKKKAQQNFRYMSTYLQWSLARPNSGFRDEKVVLDEYDQGTGIRIRDVTFKVLPKVVKEGGWLKKEAWLADYCLQEKRKGRKVLVYVRQTGTRDIQDRIKAALSQRGVRSLILKGNINARKREQYIDSRVGSIDALITNPKLVETGLDLVQFSTIVFYEIEYSLYTLWQSLRRVWRLGQTKPVQVVFAVYNNTVESAALSLIGRKMKAAQMVYGDNVASAIVPQEEGDILTNLARNILTSSKIHDLQALFSDDAVNVSSNPVIEVTPLPVQTTYGEEGALSWDEWIATNTGPQSHGKKGGGTVPEGQLSLF